MVQSDNKVLFQKLSFLFKGPLRFTDTDFAQKRRQSLWNIENSLRKTTQLPNFHFYYSVILIIK